MDFWCFVGWSIHCRGLFRFFRSYQRYFVTCLLQSFGLSIFSVLVTDLVSAIAVANGARSGTGSMSSSLLNEGTVPASHAQHHSPVPGTPTSATYRCELHMTVTCSSTCIARHGPGPCCQRSQGYYQRVVAVSRKVT